MADFYVIGLRLDEERPTYCFYNKQLPLNSKAVADVDGNEFFGTVINCRAALEKENLEAYWPIKREATKIDEDEDKKNKDLDIDLIKDVQKEADDMKLRMKVFRIYSSLDRAKVKIMYTSDDRVDFRGLLKVLAPILRARIEMRQVGPRDKAKMVGGLGICGLKLCCSTFLSAFEGITIAMAKNQMLAINIPKLSGQCGKLICCLKYEDAAYEDAKKGFPKTGTSLAYKGNMMRVISINVLNKTITLNGQDNSYETISLDEYNKIINPTPVVRPNPAPINNPNYGVRHFEQNQNNNRPNNNGYQNNNRNNNGYNNNRNNNRNNNNNNRYNNNNNRNSRNDYHNNPNRNPNQSSNYNNPNNKVNNPAPVSRPSNSNYQGEVRPDHKENGN